jgi:hypothetical protein
MMNHYTMIMQKFSYRIFFPGCVSLLISLLFCASADAQPYFTWVKGLQGFHTRSFNSYNWPHAVITDKNQDVLIAGLFIRGVDFDPSDNGVDSQSSPLNPGGYFARYDSMGNHLWARTIANAQAKTIHVDDSGYLYVGGLFYGTADFDPGPQTSTLTSKGASDFFIAKYTAQGSLIWVRGSGGASGDEVNGTITDAQGNVYVTGGLHGTIDMDERNPGAVVFPTNLLDGFVAKYDRNGRYLWHAQIKGGGGDLGAAIRLNAVGNVVICGRTYGATFAASTPYVSTNGGSDGFLASYSPNGTLLWTKAIGGNGYDYIDGFAIDRAGDLIVAGTFSGTAMLDSSIATSQMAARNQTGDAFVAKYTGSGGYIWSRSYTSRLYAGARCAAVDDSSNIYIGGYFGDTVSFNPGGQVGNNYVSRDLLDMYLLKLKPGGDYVWSKAIGSNTGADDIYSVHLDKRYNVYYAGYIGSTTVFEPGNPSGSVVVINPSINYTQNTVFGKYAQTKPVTSGISRIKQRATLIAYPNPASDQLTIEGFELGARIQATVTDIAGRRQLVATNYAGSKLLLEVKSLVPGVYFVHCIDASGSTGIVRFIK